MFFIGCSLGFLNSVVQIGDQFFKAIRDYDEIENIYKAKVFIMLFNHANVPMAGYKGKIKYGLTSQLPLYIGPGYKDAVALYQNEPTKGVAGILSYTFPGNYRIFVYTKVGQKLVGRKENKLGVCIARSPEKFDDDWYEGMTSGDTSCLGIHNEVATEPQTLQCCHGDYCIQALMTSSHQANMTVLLLPRKIEKLALAISGQIDNFGQTDLDHLLDIPESCDHPNPAGPPRVGSVKSAANPVRTSVSLILVVLTLLMV